MTSRLVSLYNAQQQRLQQRQQQPPPQPQAPTQQRLPPQPVPVPQPPQAQPKTAQPKPPPKPPGKKKGGARPNSGISNPDGSKKSTVGKTANPRVAKYIDRHSKDISILEQKKADMSRAIYLMRGGVNSSEQLRVVKPPNIASMVGGSDMVNSAITSAASVAYISQGGAIGKDRNPLQEANTANSRRQPLDRDSGHLPVGADSSAGTGASTRDSQYAVSTALARDVPAITDTHAGGEANQDFAAQSAFFKSQRFRPVG